MSDRIPRIPFSAIGRTVVFGLALLLATQPRLAFAAAPVENRA